MLHRFGRLDLVPSERRVTIVTQVIGLPMQAALPTVGKQVDAADAVQH